MKRYNPEIHRNLRPATTKLKNGHRIETAIDISNDNMQVFILDRREVLSLEDGFALSAFKDKLPPVSNIRK